MTTPTQPDTRARLTERWNVLRWMTDQEDEQATHSAAEFLHHLDLGGAR